MSDATRERTMAAGTIESTTKGHEVVVSLHGSRAPSTAEWLELVEILKSRSIAAEWDLARIGNLVVTDGSGPSTEQRTLVNNMVAQGKSLPNVAIVTDSLAARTLVRGLSIFNPRVRIFAPKDFDAALAFAGLGVGQRAETIAMLDRLERDSMGSGSVATLSAIRNARR